MNEVKTFNNEQFGEVRVMERNGEPWFVGKDVAGILGYERPTKAVADHVDPEDRDAVPIQDCIGRMQNTPLINESGLYSLILSSKLPTAKQFKRWVTSEVLPSIRKHGGYVAGQESMSDDELMAKALLMAHSKIEEREKQIKEMIPKAIFADAVAASHTSILIGDLAKLLKQNGHDIGQKRLFGWLRENGYLIRQKGNSWNMPTQRSMDLGLFEVKETTVTHADDIVKIS